MRWRCSRVLLVLMVMGWHFALHYRFMEDWPRRPCPARMPANTIRMPGISPRDMATAESARREKARWQLLEHPTAYRSPGHRFYGGHVLVLWASIQRCADFQLYSGHTDDPGHLLNWGKCFSDKVALLAAASTRSGRQHFSTRVNWDLNTVHFSILLLYLDLARVCERASWPRAIAAGVLLGLAMLTRGNAVLMVALMVPWSVWQFWRTRGWLSAV